MNRFIKDLWKVQNLSLEELHRDIQDIKSDIKDIQRWAMSEMEVLSQVTIKVEERLVRLETKASLFALLGGSAMGIAGEIASYLLRR